LRESGPLGESLQAFTDIIVGEDVEKPRHQKQHQYQISLRQGDAGWVPLNKGRGDIENVPVFNLVLAQDADELSAEPALRGGGCAFHEEHDRSVLGTSCQPKYPFLRQPHPIHLAGIHGV